VLVVCCVVVAVWYCAMVNRLWSRNMLSGCSKSSSVRHCFVVLFVVCHWHKYVFLMACAPYLSFVVVVFPFIILCMAFPSIGFGVGSMFCVF
jgi:hypothetical protein